MDRYLKQTGKQGLFQPYKASQSWAFRPSMCTCVPLTFGVEESKQLSAQLSVGHGLFEEGVLLCQLLGAEVLRLPSHPVVVVQHCQQSSVGGSGEQNVLVQVSEQAGGRKLDG